MQTGPPSSGKGSILVQFIDQSQPPLYLNGPVVRLGRSPAADVLFPETDLEVSEHHAKLVRSGDELILFDTESLQGVFVNNRPVSRAKLRAGDRVRLGPRGRELYITLAPEAEPPVPPPPPGPAETVLGTPGRDMPSVGDAEVLGELPLTPHPQRIGRASSCDLTLDSLHVSAVHALIWRDASGAARVRDLGSTNGTFVGRARVGETTLLPGDELLIGPFFLRFTGTALRVFDTRGRTWVEARKIEHQIGSSLILDEVSLAVQPGEFVGLLGPSGAGKSMLLKSLCGSMRASGGQVLVNGLDFYAHYAELKGLVGYVPQDDLIHPQLTVVETLSYAAALRLPRQVEPAVRARRVTEVLTAMELQNHARLPARQLSGGQRKRLSLGVELLTEPNLLFLDEPTAGLDPNLEEKMMVLFRELAQRGKTVLCVTHNLEHIELCDKIGLLYGGRLAYFGPPREALSYFGVRDLAEAYHLLEEHPASHWKEALIAHQGSSGEAPASQAAPRGAPRRGRRAGPGALRQLSVLSRRYARILTADLRHTSILLLQAPILGALIALATRSGTPGWRPTSVMFLMLSLAAFWLGCVSAAREITKEEPVTRRERMVGVGVVPYVLSKLLTLQLLALIQVDLLLLTVNWLGPPRQLSADGVALVLGGLPGSFPLALANLYLTALGGISLGLLISSLASNSDKAMSLVPLAVLPQILFAGALSVPRPDSLARVAGYLVGVNWSYDLFRREIACTHEELFSKVAPECLPSFDPNRSGEVMGHLQAPGRELVLLVKDGLYSISTDLAVMGGMVLLFLGLVVLVQWRKKTI